MKNKLIVKLEGGLGNQLFQYAAGRSYALKHSCALYLDTSLLNISNKNVTYRKFELDFFSYHAKTTKKDAKFFKYLRGFKCVAMLFNTPFFYKEKSRGYDENFLKLPINTIVSGYWQSFKYFDDISAEIMSDLTATCAMSPLSNDLLLQIESHSESVAIHIRRGDYISHAGAAKFHGSLSVDYYRDSIRRLRENLIFPKFFIFSDDPVWCLENLDFEPAEANYITHNLDGDAWQDLVLMSHCKHHIIANSSFSWWGAWMADQRFGSERKVFAPKSWFVFADVSAEDRFPSHWNLV